MNEKEDKTKQNEIKERNKHEKGSGQGSWIKKIIFFLNPVDEPDKQHWWNRKKSMAFAEEHKTTPTNDSNRVS